MEPVTFKRWTNKKYAVLQSFHKIIRIGALALSCIILNVQPLIGQTDTTRFEKIIELEEVESVGEQSSDMFSAWLRDLIIIGGNQLQPVSSRAIPDVLDQFPGIDLRTRGARGVQSDLSIRGGSFDQSVVMINGINFSDPQTGHFNLDLPITTSNLNKIEILTGPSMKKLGVNAYSGAVNLITKPADSLVFTGEAGAGQYQSFQTDAAIHVPYKSSRHMLAISRAGSNGYRANTDFLSNHLYYHSETNIRNTFADLMLGYSNKNFGANAFYTPLYPEQFEETATWIAALKFRSSVNRIILSGNIYWRRHHDHFLLQRTNPAFYENFHLTDILGGSVSAKRSSKAGITTGDLKYRYEQIFSTNLGKPIAEKNQKGILDPKQFDLSDDRMHLSLSIFHAVEIQKLYINGGLLIHTGTENLIKPGFYPGIDVAYRIRQDFGIFASYNRSMRLPTFTDLYYQSPQNLGNPDLLPETAHTSELGFKYNPGNFSVNLSAFYRIGNQTIDWIWNGTLWQTMNLTKLETVGADLQVNYRPESKNISKYIDYLNFSLSQIHLEKHEINYTSNYALDNLKQKIIFATGLEIPFKLNLDVKLSRQDRNGSYLYYEEPESIPQERPYEPFWLLDLNLNRKIHRLTLYADISNIFNTRYRDIGSVEMPGRWIMVGLKWN